MKRLMRMVFALGLMLGFSKMTQAATTEQLTITIAPSAFYSLALDTATVGLDLGTVDMSASTQTVQPATVTINSTFATTDVQLAGAITSAGTAWTFDESSGTVVADQIAAWGMFTGVNITSAQVAGGNYFNGTAPGADSDMINTTSRYAGDSVTHGNNIFEDGQEDLNAQTVGNETHLWFYFRMPSASTSSDAQNLTMSVTAVAPN